MVASRELRFNHDILAHHQHTHLLPLMTELSSRGGFKRFHHESVLFHSVHQTSVGMVADDAGELCMVVVHDACVIDDDIVDIPMTGLIDDANTYVGIHLATKQRRSHLSNASFPLLKQVEHLLIRAVADSTGNGVAKDLNKESNTFTPFSGSEFNPGPA